MTAIRPNTPLPSFYNSLLARSLTEKSPLRRDCSSRRSDRLAEIKARENGKSEILDQLQQEREILNKENEELSELIKQKNNELRNIKKIKESLLKIINDNLEFYFLKNFNLLIANNKENKNILESLKVKIYLEFLEDFPLENLENQISDEVKILAEQGSINLIKSVNSLIYYFYKNKFPAEALENSHKEIEELTKYITETKNYIKRNSMRHLQKYQKAIYCI